VEANIINVNINIIHAETIGSVILVLVIFSKLFFGTISFLDIYKTILRFDYTNCKLCLKGKPLCINVDSCVNFW
jgi:hypothetical protein